MRGAVALSTFLLALTAVDARAQVGRVAGTIFDEAGRPLKGATVTAENREFAPSTFTSSTDAKGRFSILGLRRGNWLFTIQAPGFEQVSTQLDVVTTRPNPPLNVQLTRSAASAPPGPLAGVDARDVQRRIDAAQAMAASGDYAGAIAAYTELLKRVPSLSSIYLQIGALNERLNETAAALSAYRRLLEREPANSAARAAIDRLSR
jgi:tetratricopeptide (TPR) repeat protein